MKKLVSLTLALASVLIAVARADDGRYVTYRLMSYVPTCIHTGDEVDIALQPDDGNVIAIGMPDPRYEPHSTPVSAGGPHVVVKAKSAISEPRTLTVLTERRSYHFAVTSGACATQFIVFQAPRKTASAPRPKPTPTLAALTSCPVRERFVQSGNGFKYFPVSLVCAWHGRTYVMLAYPPRDLPPIYVVTNKQDQLVGNPTYNAALNEFVLDGEQDHMALVVDSNEGKHRLDIVRQPDPTTAAAPAPADPPAPLGWSLATCPSRGC